MPTTFIDLVGGPPAVVYKSQAGQGAALTTFTFSAVDLGAATDDRKVIITVGGGEGTRTLLSGTIGGVPVTIIDQITTSTVTAAIAIASVPLGATGDIVLTWSGAQGRCTIGVWLATGDFSVIDHKTSGASPGTGTLTTTPGGFAIGYGGPITTGGVSVTWTNLTEDFDAAADGTVTHSGAHATTAGASLAVTATYSGGANHTFVVASFG